MKNADEIKKLWDTVNTLSAMVDKLSVCHCDSALDQPVDEKKSSQILNKPGDVVIDDTNDAVFDRRRKAHAKYGDGTFVMHQPVPTTVEEEV